MTQDQTPQSSTPLSDKKGAKARIKHMRERVKRMMDNPREKELRKMMVDDLKFVHEPGAQWDEYTRAARGDNRPTYQFNRLRVTIKRVINNMRNNRPQGKVRAFEDGDKDTAEIYEGQLRNIAYQSDFDSITDNAAEYQVAGGYAAWRVVTRYADESAFDQDIFFEGIRNPLCLWCDPESYEMTGADAKDWWFSDKISKAEYKARWPKAKEASIEESELDDNDEWGDEDTVRIGEYWWKEPHQTTIHFLSDGKTIDESELAEAMTRGLTVIKSRPSTCYKIFSAIYSGDAELEPPTEFAGYNFPWVRVYGDYINIEGKVTWSGLTRHTKDAQRAFNVGLTSAYENVARSSIAQIWATPTQAKGLSKEWARADKENSPVQLYNADPAAPGPPQRVGGAEVPVAQIQMSQIGAEEIKANSGIFDASLGNKSNETSGVALRAREAQGEIATFNYQDNMAKAVARTWKIAIGMIPYVIDTPRSLRVLGVDGSEKYVKVNQPDEQGNILNDLSRGRYDLAVTVGPSFSTQRQEAVEAYSQIVQGNPQILGVAGDLIMKSMDLPYSNEIAERIKAMLPPQILAMINKDKQMPPEVMQAMAQADQAMQTVQEHAKMVEAAAGEATELKSEAEKEKAGVQVQIANLKVQEANFKTMQAQFEALVAKSKAELQKIATDLSVQEIQNDVEAQQNEQATNAAAQSVKTAQDAMSQIEKAVNDVKAETQNFLTQAASFVDSKAQEIKDRPKATAFKAKRSPDGKLVADVDFSDGSKRTAQVSRVNGDLVGTIN